MSLINLIFHLYLRNFLLKFAWYIGVTLIIYDGDFDQSYLSSLSLNGGALTAAYRFSSESDKVYLIEDLDVDFPTVTNYSIQDTLHVNNYGVVTTTDGLDITHTYKEDGVDNSYTVSTSGVIEDMATGELFFMPNSLYQYLTPMLPNKSQYSYKISDSAYVLGSIKMNDGVVIYQLESDEAYYFYDIKDQSSGLLGEAKGYSVESIEVLGSIVEISLASALDTSEMKYLTIDTETNLVGNEKVTSDYEITAIGKQDPNLTIFPTDSVSANLYLIDEVITIIKFPESVDVSTAGEAISFVVNGVVIPYQNFMPHLNTLTVKLELTDSVIDAWFKALPLDEEDYYKVSIGEDLRVVLDVFTLEIDQTLLKNVDGTTFEFTGDAVLKYTPTYDVDDYTTL